MPHRVSKAVGAQSAVVADGRRYAARPQTVALSPRQRGPRSDGRLSRPPGSVWRREQSKKLQSKPPQPRERKIKTAAPTNQTTLSAMKRIDREIQDASILIASLSATASARKHGKPSSLRPRNSNIGFPSPTTGPAYIIRMLTATLTAKASD
jgi:hypothetical protein